MNLPELTANTGIYRLHWPEEQVEIILSRFSEHSEAVSAEVVIRLGLPGQTGHLHHARLNLTSTAAKRTLAKALSEQAEGINWIQIIEQACVMSLVKHREGEPIKKVGIGPPSPGPQYLVWPFLIRNECNLIYGDGGVGKSFFACFLALMVQGGLEEIGYKCPERHNVLYLDWEVSEEEIEDRIQMIKGGMALEEGLHIFYRHCTQALHHDIIDIQKLVLEIKANLIIVDSVGLALGTDLERWDAAALRYFQALRSLRETSLSIDHLSKEGRSKETGPFGSRYKYNTARNIFELKRSQVIEEETILGLYHRKINNGRLLKPFALKMRFDNDNHMMRFDRAEIREIPELGTGMGLEGRIREVLRRGPKKVAEIAAELGTGPRTVRTLLSRYKDSFTALRRGEWGLLDDDSPPS